MLIVAALGGNALLQRGQPLDAEVQRRNVKTAAAAIAMLIDAGHDLVVTHGNGPQVGLLALQSEAFVDVATYPLDVLGAQTEGMIGYLLEQELANQLQGQPVAALLAQHLRADALLLLTDADAVYTGWGTPAAKRIRRAHPDEIDALSFPAGSMGPKVGAACQFARATGRLAAIGARADAPLL